MKKIMIIFIVPFLIFGQDCTDPAACNYNENATDSVDCVYAEQYYDCNNNCLNDSDGDFFCDEIDNCPDVYNPDQDDTNWDTIGDDCDGIGLNEELHNKKIIYIVDILGRSSTNINETFQLYIYNDGSIEKKYLIK
jgi:hypothetical protein